MNIDAIESSTAEAGITTIEQAEAQAAIASPQAPPISAKDALGLEDNPREMLKYDEDKVAKQVPKETMQRDETGRFTKPGKKAVVTEPKTSAAPTAAKPAAGKAPSVAPPPSAAPAAAPAPSKVKIGDREYTPEQLEQMERMAAIYSQQQKGATTPQTPPQPNKPEEPSKEQITQMENAYVNQLTQHLPDTGLTEDTLEKILVGGKEGLETLNGLMKTVAARAILESRKSIYGELNPVMSQIIERVNPLVQNNEQLERYAVEQQFMQQHPEYTGESLAMAKYVADQLVTKFPQHVANMTREQFISEVDRQADKLLSDEFKRWNPSAKGTWKDWAKSQRSPAAAPSPAPAAVPAPAPSRTAAPAAPTKPVAKPPAANSPGGVTGAPKDWQRSVAGSLIG